jgi:aspartate racemase
MPRSESTNTKLNGPLGPFVGILGGMGPAATVDLMGKIVQFANASTDQEHVPVVAHNVAQIPDRQVFLKGAGDSPLPALIAGLERLNSIGAGLVLIPCNTAHIWYDELVARSAAPIVHIADAALAHMKQRGIIHTRIGLIATPGTVAAGFYQRRLAAAGYECVQNTPAELDELFTPGCYAIKAGRLLEGGGYFVRAARQLEARGATHWLLACTEIPIGLNAAGFAHGERAIDATAALAYAACDWWHGLLSRQGAQLAR